jgi:ubiquinone/menaquinone biosynthesis C-methylase UbiE
MPVRLINLTQQLEMLGLQNRVKGIVGSMDNLPFQNGEFDLIWSEGAIANIGFEKGLNHWKRVPQKRWLCCRII